MPGRVTEQPDTMSSSPQAPSASATRTSGRVRKPTEHFMSTNQGKRKRAGRDDGDDVDMADEDGNVDDSDEDSVDEETDDDEEARARAKRSRKGKSKTGAATAKRPAQKKPKTTDVMLPFRGTSKTATKKRATKQRGQAVDRADAQAAGGLYADVFASEQTIEEVVSAWMKAFDEHESRALSNVINFVLKCAGCDIKITEHNIEDVDGVTSRLTDIQDEYMASEPTDYPLIAKGKVSNAFKQTITDFVITFVKTIAANGLLHSNPELMENIEVWFSTMTSAASRSIRHTSTLASLGVLTALCDIAKELKEKSSITTRQAESERKKSRVNKERVKQLQQKVKEAAEQHDFVESLIKDWFDVIFIHRYRDVDPAIRRDCVEALGEWIMMLPDVFFDGHHLRYLGWVLSDVSPATRGEDVRQLCRLYSDSSKLVGLKTFTERFRARLVEIGTADSDVGVRIAGIELLNILRDNELLQPDDIDAVGKMIFHDDVRIRKAVAEFFSANVNDLYISKVEGLGGEEALEEVLPAANDDNYGAPRLDWLRYKSLAELLHAYDSDEHLPEHVARNKIDGGLYLDVTRLESRFSLPVAVLYDKMKELEQWLAIAGYLLHDHSSGRANGHTAAALSQLKQECVLSEQEEIILLEVLNAVVRLNLDEMSEKSAASKGKLTKQQRETMQEEQEQHVRHLVDLIPQLLKKFGSAPGTAAAVLRLESVLSRPSLQQLRQDSTTYEALLDDLSKQFLSHGTDDVLAPATAAIAHARSYGEIEDTTSEKLSSLWEDVIGNLADLLHPTTVAVRGASKTEELLALNSNLRRIYRLSTISDCSSPLEDNSVAATNEAAGKEYRGAIDFIIDLVNRACPSTGPAPDAEDAALEDTLAARAAEAALHYFQWNVKSLISTITTGTEKEIPYQTLEALAERRDAYVNTLAEVLTKRKPHEEISVTVAGCLLDLYTVSNVLGTVNPKPGMSDDYTVLIMDFDASYQDRVMKVFIALEKTVAKLTGKKLDAPVSETHIVREHPLDDDAEPIDEDEDNVDPESDTESIILATTAGGEIDSEEAKLLRPLLAQMNLCKYTSKIILAITAGVIRDPAVRRRIERNKTKLGANFKEVLAFLDVAGAKERALKKAQQAAKLKQQQQQQVQLQKKGKPQPKSNAIVAEDEMDDEIEDDDDEEARENALEEEERDAQPEEEVEAEEEDEAESVVGD